MKILNLKNELLKRKNDELQYLLLELLKAEKIDIQVLIIVYENFLKDKKKKQNILINKMGMWLASYWTKPCKSKDLFLKTASAYALIKSGTMASTGLEKDLKAHLEKHKYEEDEYGFPQSEIR